jgi:copper chaperone
MTTTTLKVSGMTCGHCVRSVTDAIGALDGVQSTDVELKDGRAVVVHDETKVSPRDLVSAVMEEGYTAEEVSG